MTNPNGHAKGSVSVSIVSAVVSERPLTWRLVYEVRNSANFDIWLIDDDMLVLERDAKAINLSYAREPLQPGVHVFGYFIPEIVRIPAGQSERRSIEIAWPCELSETWNVAREVSLPAGTYQVTVTIGFASTEAPGPPTLGEKAETSVLEWQQKAHSPPVEMIIPRTASSN